MHFVPSIYFAKHIFLKILTIWLAFLLSGYKTNALSTSSSMSWCYYQKEWVLPFYWLRLGVCTATLGLVQDPILLLQLKLSRWYRYPQWYFLVSAPVFAVLKCNASIGVNDESRRWENYVLDILVSPVLDTPTNQSDTLKPDVLSDDHKKLMSILWRLFTLIFRVLD